MMSVHRFLSVSIILLVIFNAGVSFAQEDHVCFKRIIGDFYDITISGERNGIFVKVELVQTTKLEFVYMMVNPQD